MFKSQDILLICIIIILIIVICYYKNNNKEGFVSDQIFDIEKLKEVNDKLEGEAEKIEQIKTNFNNMITRYKDQDYVKVGENYEIYDKNNVAHKDQDKLKLSKLIDINNLVKLNTKLINEIKNNPFDEFYKKIIESLIKERLEDLQKISIKLQEEKIENEEANKNIAIKSIKHIDSSVMFDLEKLNNDEGDDNIYKIKYINDNNDNNEGCNNKCLTFKKSFDGLDESDVNYNKDDYYSFDECSTEQNKTQLLKVNHIRLDYKCYKNDLVCLNKSDHILNEKSIEECENDKDSYIGYEADDTGKSISDCYKDLKTHLKYDKNNYVKNHNDILTYKDKSNKDIVSPLSITTSNIEFLPNDFVVITPNDQSNYEPKQCLTVDNDGLSFQDCNLFENQRFNYERV
jgi:hypothetical protein